MLTQQGIDTDYQVQLIENYQRRAERLGYSNRNPLFKPVIEFLEPARGKPSEIAGIKPLDDAMLILCDLYRQKYGIQIWPLIPSQVNARGNEHIAKCLRASNGDAFGLIVPSSVTQTTRNYSGHVVPYVVQQSKNVIQIMNLDSMPNAQQNFLMTNFIRDESNAGNDVIEFKVSDDRQTSKNGCKVDSIQILKDTLRFYKEGDFDSLHSLLGGTESTRIKDRKQVTPHFATATLMLPPFLLKTAQRGAFIREQGYENVAGVQPFQEHSLDALPQSIERHRSKYSAPLSAATPPKTPTEKTANHFLLVKAYHQIGKVLDKLESFETASDRQHYLRRISIQ
ncbi:hypothetical protein [Limnobacter parvus]|uniref:Uncharacterized protein n=1 Tax=Limnobacter parvus TaxID=2939690 RepID=A0ABT1XCR9_9BURK|nr:hypothetical protein [Limnobacter parvus]MCR2745086.1 hypothetical protein [Limnobacter parvus]